MLKFFTYFCVTIFLPFTNFVDVDEDRKLPPIPGWPPPLKDELEKDENLWQQTQTALIYTSSLHHLACCLATMLIMRTKRPMQMSNIVINSAIRKCQTLS